MKWIKENKEVVIGILVSIIAICAIIVFIRLRVKAAENKIQDTNNQLKGRWNCYRINEKEAKNSFFSLEFDGDNYAILYDDTKGHFISPDEISFGKYICKDISKQGWNYEIKNDENFTIGFILNSDEFVQSTGFADGEIARREYTGSHLVKTFQIKKLTDNKLILEYDGTKYKFEKDS